MNPHPSIQDQVQTGFLQYKTSSTLSSTQKMVPHLATNRLKLLVIAGRANVSLWLERVRIFPGCGNGPCVVDFDGRVDGRRWEMNMSVTPDERALPNPPPVELVALESLLVPFFPGGGSLIPTFGGGKEANLIFGAEVEGPACVFEAGAGGGSRLGSGIR